MVFYPAAMGALTQLWAGTTDEGLKMNGKVCPMDWAGITRISYGSVVLGSVGEVWQDQSCVRRSQAWRGPLELAGGADQGLVNSDFASQRVSRYGLSSNDLNNTYGKDSTLIICALKYRPLCDRDVYSQRPSSKNQQRYKIRWSESAVCANMSRRWYHEIP